MWKYVFVGVIMTLALQAGATECTQPSQRGCFDIVVLNARFDADVPAMEGMDVAARTQQEVEERTNQLGEEVFDGLKDQSIKPAAPRTFLIRFWGVNPEAMGLQGYQLNVTDRRGELVEVERVDPSNVPPLKFDASARDPGQPAVIVRVTAKASGSFQIPWDATLEGFEYLICEEVKAGERSTRVYPRSEHGLWGTREALAVYKDKLKKGLFYPFFFRQ